MSDLLGDEHSQGTILQSDTDSSLPRVVSKLPSPKPSRSFFVAAPRLPSAQKRQYKPLKESAFFRDMKPQVDKVVGEATVGQTRYYFASYDGGIAYKVRPRRHVALFITSELTRFVFSSSKQKHLPNNFQILWKPLVN